MERDVSGDGETTESSRNPVRQPLSQVGNSPQDSEDHEGRPRLRLIRVIAYQFNPPSYFKNELQNESVHLTNFLSLFAELSA